MFFSSDKTGYITVGAGFAVLVGVGVIFSHFVQGRVSSHSWLDGTAPVETDEFAKGEEKIRDLDYQVAQLNAQLQEGRRFIGQAADLSTLAARNRAQAAQLAELQGQAAKLHREVDAITTEAAACRVQYREQVRRGANGEKLAELRARNGQIYKDATIASVTAEGLTLRYEGGLVRLKPWDLDRSWSERFDWSPDETVAAPAQPNPSPPPPPPNKAKKETQLESSRRYMQGLAADIAKAEANLAQLQSQRTRSSNLSAPGSLLSWEQAISSKQAAVMDLKRKYAEAREKLIQLDPSDPALSVK